jgi:hypothetical protein
MSTALLTLCLGLLLLLLPCSPSNCTVYAQPNQCAQCIHGTYLDTNFTCQPCNPTCLQCLSPSLCVTCAYGTFSSEGNCVPGPKHCLTINRRGVCTDCFLGYQLVGA